MRGSSAARRKQPEGLERQDDRHEKVDQHGCERRAGGLRKRRIQELLERDRQHEAAERIDQPDDERREESTANRADSPDDDDDERKDEDVIPHARLDRENRGHEESRQPGERSAETEQ